MPTRPLITALRLVGAAAAGGFLLAACGQDASGHRPARPSGVADVAYAGSLEYLNEQVIGLSFARATGYGYTGRGGGSFGLAKEILAGEITPNVFESIGTAPIAELEPRLTTWSVTVAASPIVLAYNPHTSFAPELAAIASGRRPLADLFSILSQPGFLLGRTNPNTDPQGQAFYEMVELAASRYHLPADTPERILGALDNPQQVFAETALEARLESGQLDAASAFLSQAIQLHLPYVALPTAIDFGAPSMNPTYRTASLTLADGSVVHGHALTVALTTLGHHDVAAADAFAAYLIDGAGREQMAKGGYTLLRPTIEGTGVPSAVRRAVASA